jgi:3-oxoacyl-[acyl-carrier protein] reductase
MKDNREGKIILISSLYATVTKEGRLSYASSKHAITGLVKSLAVELAPYDICVNAVAPGYVMTEMTKQNLSSQEIENIKEMIPMGRFQKPEEIANAVMFLGSEWNKSITGQTLNIDGGFLCK